MCAGVAEHGILQVHIGSGCCHGRDCVCGRRTYSRPNTGNLQRQCLCVRAFDSHYWSSIGRFVVDFPLMSTNGVCIQSLSLYFKAPSHRRVAFVQTGADSVTSLRTATYFPALTGMGISQSAFTLAPCALRSPHIHQRGSGLLYAHDGEGQTALWHTSLQSVETSPSPYD